MRSGVIVVMGASGSGKSVFCRGILDECGPWPGGVHIYDPSARESGSSNAINDNFSETKTEGRTLRTIADTKQVADEWAFVIENAKGAPKAFILADALGQNQPNYAAFKFITARARRSHSLVVIQAENVLDLPDYLRRVADVIVITRFPGYNLFSENRQNVDFHGTWNLALWDSLRAYLPLN